MYSGENIRESLRNIIRNFSAHMAPPLLMLTISLISTVAPCVVNAALYALPFVLPPLSPLVFRWSLTPIGNGVIDDDSRLSCRTQWIFIGIINPVSELIVRWANIQVDIHLLLNTPLRHVCS